MTDFNLTLSGPSTFILKGIPGLEVAHIWISIPYSAFYIFGLLGNITILFVIIKEQTLHKPMYLLLCMLALTDIIMTTSVVPRALCIFWFAFKVITMGGCLSQMFFLNVFGTTHSAILVVMAFDRYVAICDPLRYASIFTNTRAAKLALVGFIRAILLALPLPVLLKRLPFCENRIISHTYCEHIAVYKISCGDTTINQTYGKMMGLLTVGLDVILISFSYVLIIRAIVRLSCKRAHKKALHTCTAHICVIFMVYTPTLFSTLLHTFAQGIGAQFHILLASLHLLIPSTLNPIVYGVKTKDLREKVRRYIYRM